LVVNSQFYGCYTPALFYGIDFNSLFIRCNCGTLIASRYMLLKKLKINILGKRISYMNKTTIKPLLLAIVSAYAAQTSLVIAETIDLEKVEVISTTPLKSVGVPIEQIPAAVQTVKAKDLEKTQSLDITDYMNRNMTGVYVNEIQNNPLQADVNYRGFTASPLLGTPQGLSVYMDGVRMNQAFGDIVSWDLIPRIAIQGMQIMPGSNPLFGLNTLGGALSIQTKDGRSAPGGAVQATLGSYGRKLGEFEYGGVMDSIDYYVAGSFFDENGWRDKSESDYQQLFGKLGWHGEKTDLKLTYAYANTDLNGNGLVPESFARRDYNSVYTYPDNTKNESHFVNLNWSHYFTDNVQLSGNTYYRRIKSKTYNGDLNDEALTETVGGAGQNILLAPGGAYTLAGNQAACAAELAPGGEPGEKCTGVINRTTTTTDNMGIFGQVSVTNTLFEKDNRFVLGGGVDHSRIKFNQTAEYGSIDLSRGIVGSGFFADATTLGNLDGELDDRSAKLKSNVTTYSLFGTDTLALQDNLHLTVSGRYNRTQIRNRDGQTHYELNGAGNALTNVVDEDASLDGKHNFQRFNPAIGLTFNPIPNLNTYVGYNEGSRAPTSIELSCANENAPCSLPNSFAGDPPLKQVVSKTWEAGLRGHDSGFIWSAGVFRTRNVDDILFVAANASQGFFRNFGETVRQGFEGSVSKNFGDFGFGANYTFIDATYGSAESVLGNANSSQDANNEIQIKSGDRIPLIPRNIFKVFADYHVNDRLIFGANSLSVSGTNIRGNDNGDQQAGGSYFGDGKIAGYTIFNATASYKVHPEWLIFARVNNVFDKEYATAGQLGQNPFNANGVLRTDGVNGGGVANARRSATVGEDFIAPGAPRTAWVGVRYEFGGKKSAVNYDKD
jgi:outer membrane receptor protein involved in Fe transport